MSTVNTKRFDLPSTFSFPAVTLAFSFLSPFLLVFGALVFSFSLTLSLCSFPCRDAFQAMIHASKVQTQLTLTHSQRCSPRRSRQTVGGERVFVESDTHAAQALASQGICFPHLPAAASQVQVISEFLRDLFLSRIAILMSSSTSINRPRACSHTPIRSSHRINQSLKSLP